MQYRLARADLKLVLYATSTLIQAGTYVYASPTILLPVAL